MVRKGVAGVAGVEDADAQRAEEGGQQQRCRHDGGNLPRASPAAAQNGKLWLASRLAASRNEEALLLRSERGRGCRAQLHAHRAPHMPLQVLSVERDASADEIRKAYRKAALQWHP